MRDSIVSFIGRNHELQQLKELHSKSTASLVVIKGRRRIGKSRLIFEFAKGSQFYALSGLPPDPKKKINQKEAFAAQLQHYFGIKLDASTWWNLFYFLSEKCQKGQVVILLDEISWMANRDKEFLGILKTIWDQHLSQNPNLILVLCSSISSWIEKNVLSSSGFMGRISLNIQLNELTLPECAEFWQNQLVSPYEKFKFLAVSGGVPRYLEALIPAQTSEENIRRLCFEQSGILFDEFNQIFSDLFSKRGPSYKKIVLCLAQGKMSRDEIAQATNLKPGGILTQYLEDLCTAGFIQREFSWNFKTGATLKVSKYRLSDNYLRFYLKYIEPNREAIKKGLFSESLMALPQVSSVLGLQFENLVLNNTALIRKALHVADRDTLSEGGYVQEKNLRRPGCQIDYLLETRQDQLYVCELKFSRNPIGLEVIEAVKTKIRALQKPKHFSVRPVLIHMNGVTSDLEESHYFSRMIDASLWLRL